MKNGKELNHTFQRKLRKQRDSPIFFDEVPLEIHEEKSIILESNPKYRVNPFARDERDNNVIQKNVSCFKL